MFRMLLGIDSDDKNDFQTAQNIKKIPEGLALPGRLVWC
jgi:hypothetical protein